MYESVIRQIELKIQLFKAIFRSNNGVHIF